MNSKTSAENCDKPISSCLVGSVISESEAFPIFIFFGDFFKRVALNRFGNHHIPAVSDTRFHLETFINGSCHDYRMKEHKKIAIVKEHGMAYYIDDHGRLSGHPTYKNGGFDEGAEMEIEQSPASYKAGHEKVLKKLGVPKELIAGILQHVYYYYEIS